MARSRAGGRSGIWKKREVANQQKAATTAEEIRALFEAISESWSTESQSSAAFSYINQIEARALAVYGKYGLPTVQGAYWREGPNAPWTALSLAPTPGANWEKTDYPRPIRSGHASHLEDLAKYDHPADSEVGFASAMLCEVSKARRALSGAEKAGPAGPAIAFNAGIGLALAWTQWREEYPLSSLIEPEVRAKRGRREGGLKAGAKRRAQREREWAKWQAEADRVWSATPRLTKSAVAGVVIVRLRLSECIRAVTARITKSERN